MTQTILECLHRSGIARIARLWPSQHFVAINFHRVSDEPSAFHEGVIEAKPKQFREHIEWIGRRADFVGEESLRSIRRGRRPQVLLTFDDGYRDSFEVVAPILESLGVPAIFFVTPGILDKRRLGAWDRIAYLVKKAAGEDFTFRGRRFTFARGPRVLYQALSDWSQSALPDNGEEFVRELAQTLRVPEPSLAEMSHEILTWDQVRSLAKRNFSIGGHGFTHRVLSSLTLEEQAEEISETRARLVAENIRPRSFAFPFGSPDTYSWETREAALATGFEFLFSFSGFAPRYSHLDHKLMDRVAFKSSLAKYNFLLSFTGTHNLYQSLRRSGEA